MRSSSFCFFFLLLLGCASGLQLLDKKLQLKTGSMLGSVGVSIAQWDLEFDQESVDFITLYNDIYTSSRAAVAFQLQNNIQCSYQTINSLIDSFSCACTSANKTTSECFPDGYITSVGLGQACPLTSNTIIAPPAKLSYGESSVSSQLQDQCVEFEIDRINARYFYGEAPPPISTGFVPTFTIRGWNAVVNDKGALVGQVVGDGINIHFKSNGMYLENLDVCLLHSSFIDVSEQYSEYSLGYWTGDTNPTTIMPFSGLINTSSTGYVCSIVRLPQDGKDINFVPIARLPNWQDQPSARFSDGQKALLYIVATFYTILCVAAKLWWDLRAQDGTASLLALGCVSSFGILSDSLAYLSYYIINNPTPYFAIVLIFTEILPITFLVARVATRQIRNTQRSRQSSARNTHRGVSSSGSEGKVSKTPRGTHRSYA